MGEPTYRQHKILESISKEDRNRIGKNGDEADIEAYWELTRNGYLNNLCSMGVYEWIFVLEDQAIEYLDAFDNNK